MVVELTVVGVEDAFVSLVDQIVGIDSFAAVLITVRLGQLLFFFEFQQ
jgi:hypothetical protein